MARVLAANALRAENVTIKGEIWLEPSQLPRRVSQAVWGRTARRVPQKGVLGSKAQLKSTFYLLRLWCGSLLRWNVRRMEAHRSQFGTPAMRQQLRWGIAASRYGFGFTGWSVLTRPPGETGIKPVHQIWLEISLHAIDAPCWRVCDCACKTKNRTCFTPGAAPARPPRARSRGS